MVPVLLLAILLQEASAAPAFRFVRDLADPIVATVTQSAIQTQIKTVTAVAHTVLAKTVTITKQGTQLNNPVTITLNSNFPSVLLPFSIPTSLVEPTVTSLGSGSTGAYTYSTAWTIGGQTTTISTSLVTGSKTTLTSTASPTSTSTKSSTSSSTSQSTSTTATSSTSTSTPSSTTLTTSSISSSASSTAASSSSSSAGPVASNAPYNTIPSIALTNTTKAIWSRFWSSTSQQWNENDQVCGSTFQETVAWTQASISRAIVAAGVADDIQVAINALYAYKNQTAQAYSASTAKDGDIYTDDNAQIAFSFLDAYESQNQAAYLSEAVNITNYIMSKWDSGNIGGVFWRASGNYIASISTIEAALAAIRVYQHTQDEKYKDFSIKCLDFMFEYLQDTDGAFYDGFSSGTYNTSLNKGKLTYTVGCAISTMAYLNKVTSDSTWIDKAVKLAQQGMSESGPFYDENKIWNNDLRYVQLFFIGFADLLTLTPWQAAYDDIKKELIHQGEFVYNYLQDGDDFNLYYTSVPSSTSNVYNKYKTYFQVDYTYSESDSLYCDNNTSNHHRKVLMDNAAAAQILHSINRVS